VREQVVARQPLEALLEAELVASVRVAPVQIAQHRVEAERKGCIGARLDLRQQQSTLLLDLVRAQRRLQRDLGHQLQQGLPVSRERLTAHLRRLDLAVGVEATADVVGARRQLHRRALRGAAQHRAVQEVRDAGVRIGLEPGTRAQLQRGGDHADRRVLADQHGQLVGQDVPGDLRRLLGRGAPGHECQSEPCGGERDGEARHRP
jgi:hypothetical protein